jgi:hypothetical protein
MPPKKSVKKPSKIAEEQTGENVVLHVGLSNTSTEISNETDTSNTKGM